MLQATCRMPFSTLVFPLIKSSSCFPLRPFTSSTPYPLYYDLIHYRPSRRLPRPHQNSSTSIPSESSDPMDRAKRRYYRKRQKRMYGASDSDSDSGRKSDFVELKPEIVDFPRLHAREQELYFHDAFAFPWEKDKHYRMVHQLESKFFPDHSFDKAFVDPTSEAAQLQKKDKGEKCDDRALLFFDEENEKGEEKMVEGKIGVSEKKVEEFFRYLKKAPNVQKRRSDLDVAEEDDGCQPFLSCRGNGFPAKWDGPSGTVVLVDKPKGWTSFTVCGKLRRLVKVQKVGHAGTLDPMATGLLIVCVGKATKLVEGYTLS